MAIALSIRACLAGQRVQFATATQWVARLSEAKRHGNLEAELRRLSFVPLIVVDEVGYIPFDPEAAKTSTPARHAPPLDPGRPRRAGGISLHSPTARYAKRRPANPQVA